MFITTWKTEKKKSVAQFISFPNNNNEKKRRIKKDISSSIKAVKLLHNSARDIKNWFWFEIKVNLFRNERTQNACRWFLPTECFLVRKPNRWRMWKFRKIPIECRSFRAAESSCCKCSCTRRVKVIGARIGFCINRDNAISLISPPPASPSFFFSEIFFSYWFNPKS